MPTAQPLADPLELTGTDTEKERAPLYHVILFDDDTHTYEYVIEMMMVLFGKSVDEGYQVAYEVDHVGQAIVATLPHEAAVEARQRIVTYGPDFRMPKSKGSMACMIEPVQ